MSAQHSPGPWNISRNTVHSGQIAVLHNCRNGDFLEIWSRPQLGNQDTQHANAELIAAAPELLEALNKLLSIYEEQISDEYDGTGDVYEMMQAKADFARATIAKAKGGHP